MRSSPQLAFFHLPPYHLMKPKHRLFVICGLLSLLLLLYLFGYDRAQVVVKTIVTPVSPNVVFARLTHAGNMGDNVFNIPYETIAKQAAALKGLQLNRDQCILQSGTDRQVTYDFIFNNHYSGTIKLYISATEQGSRITWEEEISHCGLAYRPLISRLLFKKRLYSQLEILAGASEPVRAQLSSNWSPPLWFARPAFQLGNKPKRIERSH